MSRTISYPGPPLRGSYEPETTVIDRDGVEWFTLEGGVPGTWIRVPPSPGALSAPTTPLPSSAGETAVLAISVPGDGTYALEWTQSSAGVPTPPGAGDVLTSTGSSAGDYDWAAPSGNATELQGVAISSTAPTDGQALEYNGSEWEPTTPSSNATALQGVAISSTAPTDGQALEFNGTEWVPTTPATPSPGGLLARGSYNPASEVTYSLGTSMAAVDTSTLFASFTAPSSGKVLVSLEGVYYIPAGINVSCGVISSGSQLGSTQLVAINDNASGGAVFYARYVATLMITGLTSAADYYFDFGAEASASGASLLVGGVYGSASVAVWEAP